MDSHLYLDYSFSFGENDNRSKDLLRVKKERKYSVDGLNIERIIDFLGENNFRVILDKSKKDSDIWVPNGIEQTLKDIPLNSRFGEFHREEVRKYFLPAINEGKYDGISGTKYNHANITIVDREYAKLTNGRKNELIWKLEFGDNLPYMGDVTRMLGEFERVIHELHGMEYVLDMRKSHKAVA